MEAKDRVPKCSRCRNHRILVAVKNHKQTCPYKDCDCKDCILVLERKQVMAEQNALKKDAPDGPTPPVLPPTTAGGLTETEVRALQTSLVKVADKFADNHSNLCFALYTSLLRDNDYDADLVIRKIEEGRNLFTSLGLRSSPSLPLSSSPSSTYSFPSQPSLFPPVNCYNPMFPTPFLCTSPSTAAAPLDHQTSLFWPHYGYGAMIADRYTPPRHVLEPGGHVSGDSRGSTEYKEDPETPIAHPRAVRGPVLPLSYAYADRRETAANA